MTKIQTHIHERRKKRDKHKKKWKKNPQIRSALFLLVVQVFISLLSTSSVPPSSSWVSTGQKFLHILTSWKIWLAVLFCRYVFCKTSARESLTKQRDLYLSYYLNYIFLFMLSKDTAKCVCIGYISKKTLWSSLGLQALFSNGEGGSRYVRIKLQMRLNQGLHASS